MSIPTLQKNGELPAGEHPASLNEVEIKYGSHSERRQFLMRGLHNAVSNFKAAGVKTIWIDGSFITDKEEPNDIDGCWKYTSDVKTAKLDPVFLEHTMTKMKDKYGLDFFIAHFIEADSGKPFPEFFQVNRDGDPKGIIVIDL